MIFRFLYRISYFKIKKNNQEIDQRIEQMWKYNSFLRLKLPSEIKWL